jgi:tetratricopeptide (TPR) repeat protein
LFIDALETAAATGETALAIDAAHMLAIAAPSEQRLNWHRRALALAEGSEDPQARAWLGSLLNNLGWTLHDAGDYAQALTVFERALAWREARDRPVETRIARWAVARCLRSLGRIEEALALQRRLRTELDAAGNDDPYVNEELGECLLALGRDAEARSWFGRAHAELARDRWLVQHEPARLTRLLALSAGEPVEPVVSQRAI